MTRLAPALRGACTLLALLSTTACVEGIWGDDPLGGVPDDLVGDDDDDGELDDPPPPYCQSSSAPFFEDESGVSVLQRRSAYDSRRGSIVVVSTLAAAEQTGLDVVRVALDGTMVSRATLFPELSRDQALPWQLEYNAAEDHFALVLLVPHYNQGGELRFVRLTPEGESLDEPTPYDDRANDASLAWDPVRRVYGLAFTRQGGFGQGELMVTTGNPPSRDEPLLIATTENDFNQGSIAGFCPGCAGDGAFIVQDGAGANSMVDADGALIVEAARTHTSTSTARCWGTPTRSMGSACSAALKAGTARGASSSPTLRARTRSRASRTR